MTAETLSVHTGDCNMTHVGIYSATPHTEDVLIMFHSMLEKSLKLLEFSLKNVGGGASKYLEMDEIIEST